MTEKLTNYFNNTTIAIKNVIYLLGGISGVLFFYFQADTHMANTSIHISYDQILNINERFERMQDEIDMLKWELEAEKERSTKRHTRVMDKFKEK